MAASPVSLQALAEAHDWCEALGSQVVVRARHGRLVTDPEHPQVWSANHMSGVRAASPEEIEAALAELEAAFRGAPYRVVDTDSLTPPAFVARLALEDFAEQPAALLMTLEGPLAAPRPRPPLDIRPVVSEADWAEFRGLHRLDGEEGARTSGLLSEDVAEGLFHGLRRKSGPARFFLGRRDGRPCAYAAAISAPGGFGMVDDVFTLPEDRRQGVATAMVAHCVEQLRTQGAATVFLTALASERPKRLYARLGFVPVMLVRRWVKAVG
jgi:GNAT superfamily N-acetyltransferase